MATSPSADLEVLRTRGTLTDDVQIVPDGKTFFWAGEYGWDLNTRETLDTQLGVFGEFEPQLSEAARDCDVLFLANIQPTLQSSVLDQCHNPRWTALDSMNLWIDIARDDLVKVIERVDCVVLNDAEIRQLTGKASLRGRGTRAPGDGPVVGDRQTGRVRRGAGLAGRLLLAAGLSARDGRRPDRRRRHASPAASAGYVASQRERQVDHALLSTAMAYGTAVASFNVEEFGTERVARLTFEEVNARVGELHRMTQFTHPSVEETVA